MIVTYFPLFSNEHYTKDVFSTGELLARESAATHKVACFNPELANIKLSRRGKLSAIFSMVQLFRKLSNGDKIVLFHLTWLTIFQLVLLKVQAWIFRKQIVLILKADVCGLHFYRKQVRQIVFAKISALLSDIVICELEAFRSLFRIKSVPLRLLQCARVRVVPNVPSDLKLPRRWRSSEKKHWIALVGRHGVQQKNSYHSLQVLELFVKENPDWQIVLIGPSTDRFNEYVLKKKGQGIPILDFGSLGDRDEYLKVLSRCKITFFGSRWEGVPLSAVEAGFCGSVVVGYEHLIFASEYSAFDFPYIGCRQQEVLSALRAAAVLAADEAALLRTCANFENYIFGSKAGCSI